MAINRTSPKKGKVVDIPTAPTIGTATAGGESATVTFTAATKGGPATTYTALSSPGSITGTGSSSPITVTGLTAGTAYTFTVRGANATGNGEYSAASNSITPTVSTAYESIATTTVGGGGASTITFSSIPSTYKHLQIRAVARSNRTSSEQATYKVNLNSDTGSNYSYHRMYGEGASTVSDGGGSVSAGYFYWGITTQDTSNIFGSSVWDILDYSNTNKNTTIRYFGGLDTNTTANGVGMGSVGWYNTNAVSSISITIDSGFSFTQYSHFALYGIKG